MPGLGPAIEAGCAYLLRSQHADGLWQDYELPTGRSDAWVTGFVGLALAGLARHGGSQEAAMAADRAARWLADHRAYAAGWGYNAETGPDADSTGYALRLLHATGRAGTPDDEAWILDRWQPDGGFATYEGPGGWGVAHPDVTPIAFAALSRRSRERLKPDLMRAMAASRDADGSWPSYWWRTRHYSTYLNGRLAQSMGLGLAPSRPVVSLENDRSVHSAFDLAFVTGNASLHDPRGRTCRELAATLLTTQNAEGFWPGGANLRVTRHDTPDPWNDPEGEFYADLDHLITTASAVLVLTDLHERWEEACR
jgi:hypothetical protein